MPKKKKRLSDDEFPSKYIPIAIIVVCILIAGKVVISDTKEKVADKDVNAGLSEFFRAGEIISDMKEVGEEGMEVAKDISGNTTELKKDLRNAKFVRVKSGNTFVVAYKDSNITVKLIGVDVPESVKPYEYSKKNGEKGKDVSDIVAEKLHEGDKILLEFDTMRQDKDSLLLAYVYFENKTMVQDWLLENGYAQTLTVLPNTKYSNHFAEIQQKAIENKVGLWNGYFKEEKITAATAVTTTIQKGEK